MTPLRRSASTVAEVGIVLTPVSRCFGEQPKWVATTTSVATIGRGFSSRCVTPKRKAKDPI